MFNLRLGGAELIAIGFPINPVIDKRMSSISWIEIADNQSNNNLILVIQFSIKV